MAMRHARNQATISSRQIAGMARSYTTPRNDMENRYA